MDQIRNKLLGDRSGNTLDEVPDLSEGSAVTNPDDSSHSSRSHLAEKAQPGLDAIADGGEVIIGRRDVWGINLKPNLADFFGKGMEELGLSAGGGEGCGVGWFWEMGKEKSQLIGRQSITHAPVDGIGLPAMELEEYPSKLAEGSGCVLAQKVTGGNAG
jgi:hypothetical protein